MKIVRALATQIGGELHISQGDNGFGTRATITFCPIEYETGHWNSSGKIGGLSTILT
jgi:hypothetical protein